MKNIQKEAKKRGTFGSTILKGKQEDMKQYL